MKKTTESISSYDLFLELEAFSEGRSGHAWQCFGAHPITVDTISGYCFRVWAPNAAQVAVFGDFNQWDAKSHPMTQLEGGIWELFIPDLQMYDTYKYAIHHHDGSMSAKADPYAFHAETRPGTASKLYDLSGYQWGDTPWLKRRAKYPPYHNPMNIYECHLGSWRRTAEGEFLSYRDVANYLVPYVKELGFTHVELLPITEFPFDGSWGYQCTGYFAATSRFGTPHDLMYLIDQLHQAGVGVILDWVPAHFPRDAFGLYHFDGTPTYEYGDSRGENAGWGTNVFDLGRNEVRSFLFSSALYWLELFHIDGLRVDAVSSVLYLDYGREGGNWIPNIHGGRENLEAVSFFQQLNTMVFSTIPNVLMIAEESTSFPKVTHPVDVGGLGFNFKWNMGWMNDICHYLKMDPFFRQHHHSDITFSLVYAFTENYILPISHDEVVHMKGSLFGKMPGDDFQRFAGVRNFYSYMMTHPGKKLTFMGAELGQWNEWHYEHSLDWHLLNYEPNQKIQAFYRRANALYLAQPALWEQDSSWEGFQWLSANDNTANTVAFIRWDTAKKAPVVVVCNFSPLTRNGYRVGLPFAGTYGELLNSDDIAYGGSGNINPEPIKSEQIHCHGQAQSMVINLAPMSSVVFRCTRRTATRRTATRRTAPELIPFKKEKTLTISVKKKPKKDK